MHSKCIVVLGLFGFIQSPAIEDCEVDVLICFLAAFLHEKQPVQVSARALSWLL